MKRVLTVLVLVVLLACAAYAQTQPSVTYAGGSFEPAEGNWLVMGDRLAQIDAQAPRAKINLRIPQAGRVEYQFDVRYISGLEDSYAALGAHLFVDQPHGGVSWGNGNSFLLWLTYDPAAYGGSGVWAQVYKSTGNSKMALHSFGGTPFHFGIPAQFLQNIDMSQLPSLVLPVRIRVDADNGTISVKDPLQQNLWWSFTVGEPMGVGRYVTLRTSSLAASFGNLRMLQLN